MTPGAAYTPGAIGDAPAASHRYWPQPDGMRTLAVALVLVGHSWVRHFHGAELGVGLFFALSGFLITGLLMDELGRHGRVDLARFTGRRALRLVPASGPAGGYGPRAAPPERGRRRGAPLLL